MATKKKVETKKQATETKAKNETKETIPRSCIVIEPFMVDLELPTNELLVYAVLYKITRKAVWFDNQEQLLSELTQRIGIRRKDAFYGLNSLIANNLVETIEKGEQIEYITNAPMGVY